MSLEILDSAVKPRNDIQSGFTLLEVILSIAILTTLVMITINVLSSEMFLRQKILSRYPFDKIMSRIAQDISSALTFPENPIDKQINFTHSNTLENSSVFFTVLNHESLLADLKESNLARIGYLVERNENKNQLVRIVDTQMAEWKYIPQIGVGVRSVLIEDVKEFKLKFWKQTEFVDNWDSAQEEGRLPKMVKISLTLYMSTDKQSPAKKQELQLEEIVYIRNSNYIPRAGEIEPEAYTWQ